MRVVEKVNFLLDADLTEQASVLRELLFAEVPPATIADGGRVAAFRRLLVDRVLHERHVGVGSLCDAFPMTLAAWHEAHPADAGLRQLAARFLRSPAYQTSGGPKRPCVEEAFARFAIAEHIAADIAVKRCRRRCALRV